MSQSRIFYGWWVTITFSVMVFVSAGVRHAVGPFLKPMVADLGVDRASFSLVIALGLLLYGLFMPWVGSLVDRLGARLVTSAGSVVLAASLALTGLCANLWQLALVYGVLASLGLAAVGPVVANAVVSRWFVRRRGTAVSLLGSAAMTGMSLLVPVVAWLILAVGWRMTYALHRPRRAGGHAAALPLGDSRLARVDRAGARRPEGADRAPLPPSPRARPSAPRYAPWPSGSSPRPSSRADSR